MKNFIYNKEVFNNMNPGKRKFIFIILSLLLLFNLSLAGAVEPLAITGHVRDIVTQEAVDYPNVYITCAGRTFQANIKSDPDSGDLNENGFDFFQCPGMVGTSIKIKAEHPDDPTCYGEKTFNIPQERVIDADIGICCYPVKKASKLNPSGALHIIQPTEIIFSWIHGEKGTGGNRNHPLYDHWEVFTGAGDKVDRAVSPIAKIVTSAPSWSITTVNGVFGQLDRQCSLKALSNPSSSNAPCPIPYNLQDSCEIDAGIVRTSWESAEIDDEGDVCHDVWRAKTLSEQDSINSVSWIEVDPAPDLNEQITPAELVTLWQVKSCDDYGACSGWAESVVACCNEISENCPDLSFWEQGGALYGKVFCNGIEINRTIIKRIAMELSADEKKISIFGRGWEKEDMEYCPWCYDGIQDYDEEGVDCGGSCPPCEKPLLTFPWWIIFLIIMALGFLVYLLIREKKKRMKKRQQELLKKALQGDNLQYEQ
jgi:hypothetical protein